MQADKRPFECWAICELFGHHQIAGRVTEEAIAGVNMLRVDVPRAGDWPPHTKYYGGAAIFAIHPCSEESATAAAERLQSRYGFTPLPVAIPDTTKAAQILAELRVAQAQRGMLPPSRDWQPGEDDDDDDYDPRG
jgi:hypothetical protein